MSLRALHIIWFKSFCFLSLLVFFPLCLGHPAYAQEPSKPALRAQPMNGQTITMDGLINEPVWESAPVASSFIQQRPDAGAPEGGRTAVRVVFDQTHLYVAADLIDPEPARVQADERHRDASLDRSDAFAVLIDTYHDHQNGFVFETSPLAVMTDAQVSQDGDRIHRDWDGIWEVAARRTEQGWSAEFRIPLKTLRFESGEDQIWGIQFRHRVPHRNEISFWRPLTTEQTFHEVSRAGHLTGMDATHQASRLRIKPYAKGSYQSEGNHTAQDAGLDIRYRFRSHLTLDLTARTDFAETEVDRLQVNLTRFPLFYPEKREFFLEGSGFYGFGLAGRVQPFFSRRIGLVQRQPVPIAGGGKLTGKSGPYGVGFLLMQTREAPDLGHPAEQFGVLRLTRDLGVRSNIGMIATHRSEVGESGRETLGLDATIAPHPHLDARAFWLRSRSDEVGRQAGYARVQWRDPFWRIFLYHLYIQDGFDPALGFVQQDDLAETQGYIDLRPQPATGPIREMGFKGEMTYQTDSHGQFLYQSNYWRALAYLRTGEFVMFSWDPQREQLQEDFEIRPGITIPAGTYHYERYSLFIYSDLQERLSGTAHLQWGGFYGGKIRSANLNLTLAPQEGFKLGVGWGRNTVRLAQGNFESQTLTGDVAWSFTNEMLLQGLIQWSKEEDLLAGNLRFSWEYRPGSHLFLVVNPSRQGEEDSLLAIFKMTWLWEPA